MPNIRDFSKLAMKGRKLLQEYFDARKRNPILRRKERELRNQIIEMLLVDKQKYATVVCGQCNGSGKCNFVDGFGNYVRDPFGNLVEGPCPVCHGHGVVVVEIED